MFKKLSRINWVQDIIANLLYGILTLIKKLSIWKIINPEVIKKIELKEKPLIILMWHEQVVGVTYCWKINKKIFNIVSDHPDSLLSSKIHKKLGFESLIRSSKKPSAIIRKIIKVAKSNGCIFLTPDAPHGPAHRVNSNIYDLAKKIKADVIFMTFKTNKKIRLKTWDKLRIPLPFSKGYYYWGSLINTNEFNESEFNQKIIENLNEGEKVVNEYFNL